MKEDTRELILKMIRKHLEAGHTKFSIGFADGFTSDGAMVWQVQQVPIVPGKLVEE